VRPACIPFARVLAWLLMGMAGTALGAVDRAAPSRPVPTVRLAGLEYFDAAAFGARFGLTGSLAADGRTLTLKSAWHQLELEADTRGIRLNGVRIFLGEPVRLARGRLQLGRIDAEKLLTPLLRPGAGEAQLPLVRTILLDPGHGGNDPGMQNRRLGLDEKTLALDTVLRLKPLLEAQGFQVALTRGDDRQLARTKAEDLQARAALTARTNADLFISVHYNSVESGADRVSGVEVYTLTPQFQYSHSDPERADSTVGIANLGNRHDHWNSLLGYEVHRELLRELKASDRGLKRGRLAVLRLASCPAVLVEAGFLSNDFEAEKIATPAYRQQVAVAIAEAVRKYAAALEGVRWQRADQP